MSTMPALYPRAPTYLALSLLLIFAAFYPSYFSALLHVEAIHHFHALTATAWVVLLTAQATLARGRRFDRHRLLGQLAYVIAPLLVLSGLLAVWTMLGRDDAFSIRTKLPFAATDALSLAWFTAAVSLALSHRRNVALHARYMMTSVIIVLPAALSRIVGLHRGYFLTESLVLLLIAHDHRRGRIHLPYPLLLALLALEQGAFTFVLRHQP